MWSSNEGRGGNQQSPSGLGKVKRGNPGRKKSWDPGPEERIYPEKWRRKPIGGKVKSIPRETPARLEIVRPWLLIVGSLGCNLE